jgi:hypothetical protein
VHRKIWNSEARDNSPATLTEEQKHELIQMILNDATQPKFITKGELFNEIENGSGKVFIYCWID